MPYKEFYTKEFPKRLKKFRHFRNLIENKINLLLHDPYHNCKSELLLGELKGLRSARITQSLRIIFAVCEECHRRRWQKLVGCSTVLCQTFGAKTVIFFKRSAVAHKIRFICC